jgi:hypothetical protein
MGKKSFFLPLLAFLVLAYPVSALDYDVRVLGGGSIPISIPSSDPAVPPFNASDFSIGFGGTVVADVEMFGFLAPFIELGVFAEPALNTGNNFLLVNGGAGVGFFYLPISRLKTGIGCGGGLFLGFYPGYDAIWNYYWRTRVEVGYRFSPFITASLAGEYTQYLLLPSSGVHYSGITVSAGVDINLGILTNRTSGILIEGTQDAPVFPLFYTEYDHTSMGTIKITNSEQAEIRDVTVAFRVGGYSSKPVECARYPVIQKGESVAAPLFAAFNEQVFTLTENTKVQGEIEVAYTLLDAPIKTTQALTVSFNHRNAATWGDARMLAAFAGPNDPAVLEYSKFIAGLVRDKIRPGIDSNLQYGMGFFEALRLSGISYSADPTTPYKSFHVDKNATDYIQYPYQTLAYKSGDSDDLSVLYASALESVGIKTAFIPTADEVCSAFPLSMTEAEARSTFIDPSVLIYRDGTPWIPVRLSQLREGFLAAWLGAAKLWNDSTASGSAPQFLAIDDAWKAFPPVGIPGIEAKVPKPTEAQVSLAFENAIGRFITREIGPRVEKLLSDIKVSGGTPKQYNALGILYARNGLLKEARAAFERAPNYIPSLINLGSIYFLERDYQSAVQYYEMALAIQPENKTALIGLARAKYELDFYEESDGLISRVRSIDPALADQYAYLSSRIEGSTAREASASDKGQTIWSSEGE